MAKIVFSKKAIDDLEGIKNYITDELLNETAPNKTVSKVMEKVHVLEDFPEIGAPLSSIVDIEWCVFHDTIISFIGHNKNHCRLRC